jgi:hypothetical protein
MERNTMPALAFAHPEEAQFTGSPCWHIPVTADRYDYKKKSGSSDAYNTKDEIET